MTLTIAPSPTTTGGSTNKDVVSVQRAQLQDMPDDALFAEAVRRGLWSEQRAVEHLRLLGYVVSKMPDRLPFEVDGV